MSALTKAIKLHERHMQKPATATPASQEKMMVLMKRHAAAETKKPRGLIAPH